MKAIKINHENVGKSTIHVGFLWASQNWSFDCYDFYFTLPETNISPKNGCLEYDPFLLGFGLFSGANAVSFRKCNGRLEFPREDVGIFSKGWLPGSLEQMEVLNQPTGLKKHGEAGWTWILGIYLWNNL